MTKPTHKQSTEDLLNALENISDDTTEPERMFDSGHDVPLFIAKFGIESGEHPVPKSLLYRLYKKYSKSRVSSKSFCIYLSRYFEYTASYYFINMTKGQMHNVLNTTFNPHISRFTVSHPSVRTHYELFMKENSIVPGNKWVQSYVINYIYLKWCRANRKSIRFKPSSFVRMCRMFLESKRVGHHVIWFKVSEEILKHLTEEDKEKIRDERKDRED